MVKINLIGPVFGSSGFCSHVRQLANAMFEQGIDVRLESQQPSGWEQSCNDNELKMFNKKMDKERVSILVGQPSFIPLAFGDDPKTVIPFVIWEGDSVPVHWMEHLLDKRIQQIWVPSTHVREAITNTFGKTYKNTTFPKNIKIVPHGIDLDLFKPLEKKKIDKFTFIANKGWNFNLGDKDRGGIPFLLKAYNEEFSKDDNVQLKIKLNPSYFPGPFDPNKEIKKLGIIKNENSPAVLIASEFMDYKIMPQFYQGDVFVSPSMGEAWNLTGTEAMACGIPNIQCYFGGQMEYLTKDNSWIIDEGKLIDVTWDMQYEGIKWFKPSIKKIREIMRYVYEHPDEVKKKSHQALIDSKQWSWKNSAKKAIKFLNEL